MKELRFKIRELEEVPADRRETVFRDCLGSEEFVRRSRTIQRVCFISAVVAAIALLNVFSWTGITGDSYVWTGLLAAGTVALFIVLMVSAQIWFRVRLMRKLVRRQIHERTDA